MLPERRDEGLWALFTREDAVEGAWAVVNPVLKHRAGPYKQRCSRLLQVSIRRAPALSLRGEQSSSAISALHWKNENEAE